MKCKNCNDDIPVNMVQVGGVHMHCEHEYFHSKKVPVYKIRPIDGGPWVIETSHQAFMAILNDAETDSKFEVQVGVMSKGQIEALPEFTGW